VRKHTKISLKFGDFMLAGRREPVSVKTLLSRGNRLK
jgi:hypothetical protein